MKSRLYLLVCCMVYQWGYCQLVSTSIDSTKKKIGSEFYITLKAIVDSKDKVIFPKDSNFGLLEVLENYKTDTVEKGNKIELSKRYGITQFDAGKYTIPKLPISINQKKYYTDTINLEVVDVKVDTLKQKMYDIKQITKTESKTSWWWYFLGIVFVGVIGYLVYYFVNKKPQNNQTTTIVDKRSPLERAMAELSILDGGHSHDVKKYYSELTDIARRYIENELRIPAMESTTSELLVALQIAADEKKVILSTQTLTDLEKVLRKADLVKFAKSKPDAHEILSDKTTITQTVSHIYEAIPKEKLASAQEEAKLLAEQKALLTKKKKQKTQIIVTAIALLLLLLGFVFSEVLISLKDNILGHPTKELAEGEWVYSEYGNPALKIETPKVLKRVAQQPQNKQSKIPALQKFVYGSLLSDFYIVLSTQKFEAPSNVNLESLAEGIIKDYEKEGARNIIVKSESYDTQLGSKGLKAYGSMTVANALSKEPEKLQYQILLFTQYGGLQAVLITYKDNDDYAKKMVTRIENSIEPLNVIQ